MMPPDAFEAAQQFAEHLEAAGVEYAIGGAIAYGLWGDPRGTFDVDINLFCQGDRFEFALNVLEQAGAVFDREAALRAAAEDDVVVGDLAGLRVDLFTPTIPFSWEAGRTKVRVEGPLGAAWYLSAEATVIFKLLFFRAKDLVDIEKLVVVQGGELDHAYIRRWMVDMMDEDDERVEFWDELIARVS